MVKETVSDWLVGLMVGVLGLVGAYMALNARDTEIFIFGASLPVFAVAFIWNLRRPRDETAAKGQSNG